MKYLKKFIKESASFTKADIEDLLLELCDELNYVFNKNLFLYTKEEYMNSKEYKSGNVNGYQLNYTDRSDFIINILPNNYYDYNTYDELDKRIKRSERVYKTLNILKEILTRLNLNVIFYEKDTYNWYIFLSYK
jgi:hypothetical protein